MSRIINRALLLEQLKRFWVVPLAATLAYILGIIVPMINATQQPERVFSAVNIMADVIRMQHVPMIMILGITVVTAAFLTHRHFFSPRAATTFYSLPLSRTQLLLTNALAGIILTLIPAVILSVGMLWPVTFPHHHHGFWWSLYPGIFGYNFVGGQTLNTLPIVAAFAARFVITKLFYFGLAWMAFSLAGTGIIGLLLTGAFVFLPTAAVALVQSIANVFVFGFDSWTMDVTAEGVLVLSNPGLWGMWYGQMGRLTMGGLFGNAWLAYVVYGVLTVVVLAKAFIISRVRKTERTGNSIVFHPVKNVAVFLVAFMAALLGALFGYFILGEAIVGLYLGLAIGFVLGYFIGQMIAEKSFHISHKVKYLIHFSAVAVSLLAIIFFVTHVALLPFINRVPDSERIVGVHVGNIPPWWGDVTDSETLFLRDRDAVQQVRSIHQNILDNRSQLHAMGVMWRSTDAVPYRFRHTSNWHSGSWRIYYLLDDGRVMSREYQITRGVFMNSGLQDFMMREDVIKSLHPLLATPQYVGRVDFHANFWDEDGVNVEKRLNARFEEQTPHHASPEMMQLVRELTPLFIYHARQRVTYGVATVPHRDVHHAASIEISPAWRGERSTPPYMQWTSMSIYGYDKVAAIVEMLEAHGIEVDVWERE